MAAASDNLDNLLSQIKRDNADINAIIDFAPLGDFTNSPIGGEFGEKMAESARQYWSLAVKSNVAVKDLPHTAGIGAYKNRVATGDAFCVARLREAGMWIIGTANMEEAALGATTNNPHFGKTQNPHRAGYTSGGSSGGSAAAVAAGLARMALGTDTMGSCRIPAAYCGVVGFKPSFGAISTRGIEPLSRRMDHVGLIGKNVADVAHAFSIAGVFDAACADARRYAPMRTVAPKQFHFAVLDDAVRINLQTEVRVAYEAALAVIAAAGHSLSKRRADQDELAAMRRAGLLICEAELANSLSMLVANNDAGLSPFLKKMITYGSSKSAPQFAEAYAKIDDAILLERELLRDVDAILWPTAPQTAFPFSDPVPSNQADFTCLANFTGAPAITLPIGVSQNALPVGVQLMMPLGRDDDLLHLAAAVEAMLGKRLPTISTKTNDLLS
jgi:aspartyl-tRNA(Asn)/glutamyl-tRNA(Gln) amidotransferase subunit A